MDFYFLGTGAGVPSRLRNVSALAVCFPTQSSETWLFDCGEGTQHQILKTNIKPPKISNIFISHLHGDHIFGLPGLLSTRSMQGAQTPLTIYGPAGLTTYIEISLSISQTHLNFPIKIMEIADGMETIIDQNQLTIRKLNHGIPSYGFRIQRPDRPGKIDHKRLTELGIPPGPIYKDIKQGKTVQLPDRRIINGREFVLAAQKGICFAYLGDTRPTESSIELAKQADLLIHEATFAKGAHSHYHSTTTEAAQIAKQADVGKLALTHISSRYQEADLADFLAEATAIFPKTYLAHDFWKFSIPE